MAGNLTNRLDALERQSHTAFTGYASVQVQQGQTVAEAKDAWTAANGPIGDRQVILWNFGGYSQPEWRELCA